MQLVFISTWTHIDLDRQRPHCERCLRAGFVCLGYAKGLTIIHNQGTTTNSRSKYIATTRRSPELSLVAFQDQIVFTYLFDTYAWANFGRPWLQLSARDESTSLTAKSSRALAYGIFGNDHVQSKLRVRAAELYGVALNVLSTKLQDSSREDAAKLVVPAMIMSLYAVCALPTRSINSLTDIHQVYRRQRRHGSWRQMVSP